MQYDVDRHGPIPGGEITVNGVPIPKCVYADEDRGIVRSYKVNPDGTVALVKEWAESPEDYTQVVVIEHHGNVRIECDPEERARIEKINRELVTGK